jgi:CRP-like cAMP-binding protein/cytochrome P450
MSTPEPVESQPASPPSLPGLPLLGNTIELLTKDANRFFSEAYEKLGPVFQLNYLFRKYTIMAGPESLNHLLQFREQGMSREAFFGPVDKQIGGVVLLTQPVDTYQNLRGQARLAFSRQLAAEFIPDLVACVDEGLDRHPPGSTVSVMDLCTRISFDQYSRLLCGESLDAYFDTANRYAVWVMNIGVKKLPECSVHLPAYKKLRRGVMQMADDVLTRYENRPADHGMPFTILDALATATDENGDPLPRNDLVATLQYGIIGTVVYMNRAIAFLLHDLLSNPEHYERVRKEVDDVYGNGLPDSLSLRGMSTLNAALKESMRLHPISLGMPFMVNQPFEFHGFKVPKDQFCVYSGVPNHFSADFYTDPQRFDPDRCLAPRNEHKQRRAYVPYGYGKRVCPAAGLVETCTLVAVSRIIHRRTFERVPANDPLRTVLAPLPAPDRKFRIRFTSEREFRKADETVRWQLAANALDELFESGRLLKPAMRERLDHVTARRHGPGEYIIRNEERADTFHVLIEGTVRVTSGTDEQLATLVPGDHFGEVGLLGEGHRTANCLAATRALVLEMSRDDFLAIVRNDDLVPGEIAAALRQRYLTNRVHQAVPALTSERLRALAGTGSLKPFEAGDIIIRQGDDADWFYILLTGEVVVLIEDANGTQQVATLQAGDHFGEIGILEARARTATVQVTPDGPADTLAIPRDALLELVEQHPQARSDIASVILNRIAQGAG